MRHSVAGCAVLATLVMAACSDDEATAPGALCTDETTAVDVTVSGGTSPTVSWSPACDVALFLIEGDGGDTWLISTDENDWDDPLQANRISPPVRYGDVPSGIDELWGPEALEAGSPYQVVLWRIQPTGIFEGCASVIGNACALALESFTP